MMKLKVLALAAICAAVAAQSSFAAPFTPARAAAAAATPNFKYVFASGSSAAIQLVYQAFDELCDATDGKSVFTNNAIADNTNVSPGDSSPAWGNFGAYGCKLKTVANGLPAALSPWAGVDVVYFATVDQGSFKAIEGMSSIAGAQVDFISEAFTGCTNNGASVTIKGAQVYDSCARAHNTNEAGRSLGGIMDHDKANFKSVAVAENGPPNNFNDVLAIFNATTSISTSAAQLFGIAASDKLYREMQAAQGLSTVACAGVHSVACQPTITKRQYSAIVNDDGGLGVFSSLGASPLTGTADRLGLCRRVLTSGTQVGSDINFLNACATGSAGGAKTPKKQADFGCAFSGGADTVPYDSGAMMCALENSSTGNVKACLNSSGGGANSTRALGVMSLENAPGGSDTWFWLKLDGIAPQVGTTQADNGINGSYDFDFEMVMITHPTITPGTTGTANDKATRLALQQQIAARVNDATFLVNSRGVFATGTGTVGVRGGNPANSCASWTF